MSGSETWRSGISVKLWRCGWMFGRGESEDRMFGLIPITKSGNLGKASRVPIGRSVADLIGPVCCSCDRRLLHLE